MPGNTPGSQSLMVHLAHIGAMIGLTGFAGRKAAFELMCRANAPLNWYRLCRPSPADLQARNGTGIFWLAGPGHPVPCPSFSLATMTRP